MKEEVKGSYRSCQRCRKKFLLLYEFLVVLQQLCQARIPKSKPKSYLPPSHLVRTTAPRRQRSAPLTPASLAGREL